MLSFHSGFESAGSRNGVGYYPRALNFWRDGVRYHDLGNPPAPKPPAPVEDEEDMRGYIAQTDEAGIPGQQWWLLLPSGVRQKCLSEAHRDWMASTEMLVKLPNGTADKAVRKLPASYLYQWTYRP